MANKELTFEQSVARLDQIVTSLERGDTSLEELLTLFEEGTGLIKSCGAMLDKAEQKVVSLRKGEDGTPIETPFDAAND